MSKMPNEIIFFCHGKSEIEFVNRVVKPYIELWFKELFGENNSYYQNNKENPLIIFAKDYNGETYTSINGFKKQIESQLLSTKKKNYEVDHEDKVFASIFIILDIFEDENELKEERERILSKDYDDWIILKGKEMGLNIKEVEIFYFEKSIENGLPNFDEYTKNRKGPKQLKVSCWATKYLEKLTYEQLNNRKEFYKHINKIYNSNIIKLLDKIDNYFESLKE